MTQLLLNLFPKVYCSKFSYTSHNASEAWKRRNGYVECVVWRSRGTLGEWLYVVSRDLYVWHVMYQVCDDTIGVDFTRVVDESSIIYSSPNDLYQVLDRLDTKQYGL
jgi:hypothetical protein